MKIVHAYEQKNKASVSLINRARFKQQNKQIASLLRPSKRHCCNISNNNNIESCSAKSYKNLEQNKTGNEKVTKVKTISIKCIFCAVFKCVFLDKIGQKEPSKNTFHHCNKNANHKNPLFKTFL